jgi:branched-chain amino acid transport system substrate-binding protein
MRRPRARAVRLAAVTVLTAATVAACGLGTGSTPGSGGAAGPSGKPILVGMSLSLTGGFAADGHAYLRGYQLWAADVNSHGGLLGRPVKLVYLNDNSDPVQAAKDYTKLITQYNVDLTLGPFSTLLTVPAGQVTNKYHHAFVEAGGGAPKVFQQSLPNLFGVSAPVANQMVPFAQWVAKMPVSQRPKSAAYVMVDDPFADPPVTQIIPMLAAAGVQTVYNNSGLAGSTAKLIEPDAKTGVVPPAALKAAADAVIAKKPQIVVIGSVDVPTVAGIINEFRAQHFSPQMLIAASGPDQGQAFLNAISPAANADGIMVPDGWYGGFQDALSHVMVQEYIAKYGGTASDINADVAEAYSAGQVMADAVTNVGLDQQRIINFLSSGVTLDTVQGPARWGRCQPHQLCGVNTRAASFIFQWQPGAHFVQVLSSQAGTKPAPNLIISKKMWATF